MMLRGILELTDVCCDTDSLSLSLHLFTFLFPLTKWLSISWCSSFLTLPASRPHHHYWTTKQDGYTGQAASLLTRDIEIKDFLPPTTNKPQTYKYTRSFDFNYVVNQFPGRRRCLRQDSQSNPNQSIPESPPRVHGEPPRQRVPFKPSVLRRRSFHRDSRVHLEVDE